MLVRVECCSVCCRLVADMMSCSLFNLQAYVRGVLARKETRALRQQKAATSIQTAWRRFRMRQQFNLVLHNITAVQVGVEPPPPALAGA